MSSESPEIESKVSPMMAQWHACKKSAGNALLLFRMGDFYEAFHEDAVLLAKELELTLTKRQEIPMSGVPHHSSESYIDKLVARGYRVAIAEQMEDPRKAKGIVKREIVRVVTPGTLINSSLLSDKANNFFASVIQVNSIFGLAFLDLTTGEFRVIEFNSEQDLLNELYKVHPSEILAPKKFVEKHRELLEEFKKTYDFLLTPHDDWHFDHQITYSALTSHFKVHSLDGFGLKGMLAAINAAGALLNYLHDVLCLPISHINEILTYSTAQYMSLDRITQKNLELSDTVEGNRRNTLLHILDKTRTPMGARLLRQWVKQPLLSIEQIGQRQDAIQALNLTNAANRLGSLLESVRDLERLIMKVNLGYANPRDVLALKNSLQPIPSIKSLLFETSFSSPLLQQQCLQLEDLGVVVSMIGNSLVEDPPLRINEGGIFREGFNRELDELRELGRDSKTWLAKYQLKLKEETGIKTLKIGYTKMFGYYIEVSKGQAEKMPDSFQRRQTLVNGERFITPELKDYESKVLTAEERSLAIESELFTSLRLEVAKYSDIVLKMAKAIAQIDCLLSLAEVAKTNHYTRPKVDESDSLLIEEGRHPVIETIHLGGKFIPNDTCLGEGGHRLMLITGPNMAGKSTYIRQVALIAIMAQMGSFVPAKSAHIGVIDKVFTRIGASDDLSRGQSTFMVEMTETANILNNATDRSLVILDEIGRGTSTYDGISIAWSVAEYLLTTANKNAKTLFATHYWELTKLEEKVPGAANYNVAVHESEDHIVFLRKIVRGGTDKSYGIHVGRLAGLPKPVIQRAKEILEHLEENANRKGIFEPSKPKRAAVKAKMQNTRQDYQLTFFG